MNLSNTSKRIRSLERAFFLPNNFTSF
jgi:hypothetical protein